MHLSRRAIASVVLLTLAACGGGDLTLPDEGQPSKVAMLSGDDQTGTILEAAPESLVVRVTDRFGSPVPGIEIVWTADGGGEVRPTADTTGTDGRAATQRILGEQPGSYGTTALPTALPDKAVSFTTTAVAAKLVFLTQPGATASSGAPIDPQPVLQLQDRSGNPLARSDVSVTVQIASGEGGLRGTTSRTSDADGRVAFTDLAIVGPPGARTLIFAASGYASAISTPVSLGVGAPASVVIAAGDGRTAVAGTKVDANPAVLVRDAGNTPVAGVAVTFAVASGGGSIEGGAATTGADGVATVGSWTLGRSIGPNTLQATVGADGVSGNPVTFTANAVAGQPSADKSSVSAAPGSIVASQGSSASVITVVVRDSRSNPIGGQAVTLSATGDGVSLGQPAATDASGATTGSFSATVAGPHAVSATVAGVNVGSATVTVTPDAPALSRSTASVPNGTAGATTDVQVALKDQFGNPVPGAAGQITVTVSGSNPVGGLSVEDRGGGNYGARYTPTTVGSDLVDIRLAGQPVTGSPFTSAVAPGPGDPGRTTAEVPDGSFAVPIEIVVHVADAQGNPVGHGGDRVTVTIAGQADLTVEDRGDGSYHASWRPFVIGTFEVIITLNDARIAGSYFTHIQFF